MTFLADKVYASYVDCCEAHLEAKRHFAIRSTRDVDRCRCVEKTLRSDPRETSTAVAARTRATLDFFFLLNCNSNISSLKQRDWIHDKVR